MANRKFEIIAIPSESNGGLNDNFSQRFGRCNAFTFVTVENKEITEVRTIHNQGPDQMGGAGVIASQIVGNHNATTALCGFLGSNAFNALTQLNIKLFHVPNKQFFVKEVVELYLNGNLKNLTNANVGFKQD